MCTSTIGWLAPGFLKSFWLARWYMCVCLSVCLSVCVCVIVCLCDCVSVSVPMCPPPRALITSGMIYRIMGIICGRKVSRIAFFAVVHEKIFAIQVISLYKNSGRDRKCKKTFANASRFAKFVKLFFRR